MNKNYVTNKSFNKPSYYKENINKNPLFARYIFLDNISKENESKKRFISENPIIKPPNYDELTVVIPFRAADDEKRNKNLKTVVNYLKFIGVKHIIISEEDDYSKVEKFIKEDPNTFEDIKLVFTESSELFCKSIAINEGVKNCNTEYIAISDSDVLIPKDIFNESLSLIASFFDFLYPFNRMVKQIYGYVDYTNVDFDSVDSEVETRINADGGFFFCRKSSFFNIGGYNTAYTGWGGEDNDFCLRITFSDYNIIRLNNPLYHLYHDKERPRRTNTRLLIDIYNSSKFDFHNLTKLNNLDVLINQNEDLYRNSIKFRDDVVYPDVSNYLISVIIPVYNCEFFYIDRCITSLKKQTIGFENIEVILVDDASTHQPSIDLIKNYAEKYNNIKTIFLDFHLGAGAARNAGIKAATTEYITFLDHDDYYVNDICEIAYNNMENENIDMLITNYIDSEDLNGTGWDYLKIKGNKKLINKYDELIDIFRIAPSTGTTTFRKKFLLKNKLQYKHIKAGEDLVFNQETLFHASGILLINTPSIVFSYRHNTNKDFASRSLDYEKNTLSAFIDAYYESFKLFRKYAPDYTHYALSSLNNWITEKLLKSNLSFNDFLNLTIEVRELAIHYVHNKKVDKPKKCLDLYELIVKGEFNQAYDLYKKLI
ncbi:hypothetical protein TL18_00245 [Methanobrevibacter sp. YE315]|uniref:glycosyltransferase n=1 Tax=Methanobrevibacter sp. YE315 TaxID=1609968 RepID=UPI000764CFD6|nr:glycosyltransferase [Methanobrevibacter sp. YE315]AMD16601.1 hypothetical protein TL18_00245 [Methanobrevibacter sp. YE315]